MSRHQDWEGVGNAITTDMMQTDLALIQELGATTVRLAHYQHDQHFYDLCDAAGIVVWAEIPQITEFLPAGTANATSQLTELIVQNRHHASIVCWGLSNEITVTGNSPAVLEAHRELNALAHRLDPTRLTAMAHLFLLETDHPLVTVPDVLVVQPVLRLVRRRGGRQRHVARRLPGAASGRGDRLVGVRRGRQLPGPDRCSGAWRLLRAVPGADTTST